MTFAMMLLIKTVFAVNVGNIYKAKVPVASQSSQDRNQALPQALAQVLTKVSGSSQVLSNVNIKPHLKDASNFVQEFTYFPNTLPANPYFLEVQFYPEAINKLLRNAAAPIWGPNRPLILAWMEYEVPNHPSEVIDNASQSDISTLTKQYAEQRGLPFIFPVMDVTDLNQVNVGQIMTMTEAPLLDAAKRYSSDAILIARVIQTNNNFSLHAKLIMGKDHWDWNISGKTLVEVIHQLIDNIADKLGGRFATVVSNAVQGKMTLKITNVSEQNDLSQMMQYLQHLPPVATVQIIRISGDEVILDISLRGTRESFSQVVSGGDKLTLIPSGPTDKGIVYHWNH